MSYVANCLLHWLILPCCQIRKLADHVGMEIDLEDDDDDEEEEQEGEHITYTFDATEDDLGPSAS